MKPRTDLDVAFLNSLDNADDEFRKELQFQGKAICPCCGKTSRIYKRRLHGEMALWLLKLVARYREKRGGWQTTVEILKYGGRHLLAGGTNGSLLVHWGLIERATAENAAGAPVGSYRPTILGCDFVDCIARVPAWVRLFNNELVESSGENVNIIQALGKRFNYQQLISDLRS